MVKTRAETGTEINRPGDVIKGQKKKTSKNDWFNRGESFYDSVLFVLTPLLQNCFRIMRSKIIKGELAGLRLLRGSASR